MNPDADQFGHVAELTTDDDCPLCGGGLRLDGEPVRGTLRCDDCDVGEDSPEFRQAARGGRASAGVDGLAEQIKVEPHTEQAAVVTVDGAVRVVADRADVDGSDNLTLYRANKSVAHVKVAGVPLEVPNLVRRAVRFGEPGDWS